MKGMAIKITSGLLVVALVVVVALAISGVFGGNVNNNQVVANAEASVENTQVLNGVQSNQVFYITCTKTINDLSSFVVVKDSEGNNVNLAISNVKDEKGNVIGAGNNKVDITGNVVVSVGAVNYVLVDKTNRGYGIFITNMLEEAEN